MKPSFSSVFVAAYALTIGLTLGFYAPNAEACSPPPPGVYSTVPETGSLLPTNAAVVFTGQAMMLEDFSVTVDGMAADLVPIQELSIHYYAGFSERLALKIEPEPSVDQQITILGCVGSMWDGVEENTNCARSVSSRPSDQTPPSAPYALHTIFMTMRPINRVAVFCQTSSDLAYHLDLIGLDQNTSTQAAITYRFKHFSLPTTRQPPSLNLSFTLIVMKIILFFE